MSAIIHQIVYKLVSILMSAAMLFGASGDLLKADSSQWSTNYKYVFVHGLSGWGSYDPVYRLMPYWGMFGGDLMKYLNDKGFDCYAASVSPTSSAWDRACELYAQLTGTMVDYGKAHSEECSHERFGEDYTGRALIGSWSAEDKINLLGHSFGGATVRLFASILENGSEDERRATEESELSPFFEGGKGEYIYSITTLAAPHNGTTAYNTDESEAESQSRLEDALSGLTDSADETPPGARAKADNAAYDMYIDNALELNQKISTLENTYYFSFTCSASKKNKDGVHVPQRDKMEILFISDSKAIGSFTGVTKNGYVIDESWQENDGLVNTVSAAAPFGAPSREYEKGSVRTGEWNIMPTYEGDHMSLQGGLFKVNDVKCLYTEHLSMINSL